MADSCRGSLAPAIRREDQLTAKDYGSENEKALGIEESEILAAAQEFYCADNGRDSVPPVIERSSTAGRACRRACWRRRCCCRTMTR